MRLCCCLLLCLALAGWHGTPGPASAGSAPAVSAGYSLDKGYGHFIGDVVKVSYRLALPPDQYLSEDSLPGEGAHGERVELIGKKISERATRETRVYDIELTFQVFFVADMARTFEIPGVEFSYGPGGDHSGKSLAWGPVPVTVSPLASPEDTFQPLMLWSWSSPTSRAIRSLGALILLGSMGAAAFVFRRKVRSRSPLAEGLKRLSGQEDPLGALIIFRSALNQKAGQAVFPTNLEELFRVFPQARACEGELRSLVLLSDEASFNPEGFKAGDGLIRRVTQTMKRMKRLERWA